jgi:hypothetical protein
MDLYPWVVILHVVAAFLFVLGHGASAMVAFAIRAEREPTRIAALLDLSGRSIGVMYLGLLVLLLAGIAAGIMRGWFGSGWIWAALGLLILIIVAMYAIATRYYAGLRQALGQPARGETNQPTTPVSQAELVALLDSRRPEALAAIGIGGIAVIVWLMIAKPF